MKLISFIFISLFIFKSNSQAESRFGDLTELRDERMRGKDNQWVRPHPGPFVWNNIEKEKIEYQRNGSYVVMEGPQFSSLSESNLYR